MSAALICPEYEKNCPKCDETTKWLGINLKHIEHDNYEVHYKCACGFEVFRYMDIEPEYDHEAKFDLE